MFIKFLREHRYASLLLSIFRIYLGWMWLQAGWGKIAGGEFDASGFLNGAIRKASGEHPAVQAWWADFLQGIALPNVDVLNVLVPWGEFLVGIGLITGTLTSYAVFLGLIMNFAYMFSGTTSTNPQMALIGMLILVAGINAGKLGLDKWVIPFTKQLLFSKRLKKNFPQST